MKKRGIQIILYCVFILSFLNSCEKKDIEVLKINAQAGIHSVDLDSSGPGEYRAVATTTEGKGATAYFRIVNTILTSRVRNENFDNINDTQILYSKTNENDSSFVLKTTNVNTLDLICFEYDQFLIDEEVTFMVSEKCEVVFYKE